MIITPYPKTNTIKEMSCYFYPGGLFFGANIIIAKILGYYTLWNPCTLEVTTLGYPTKYNECHNKT